MRDTTSEIQNIFFEKMMKKSGVERMEIGASMFDTSINIMKLSFSKNISKQEKKIYIFKRLYSNDFSKEQINEIVEYLVNNEK